MTKNKMNPLLQQFLVTVFRWALTFAAGVLVKIGIFKEASETEQYVAAGALALAVLAWSLWSRYKGRIAFLKALDAPAGTTEAEIKAQVKAKAGPAVGLFLILGMFALGVAVMFCGCRNLAAGGVYDGDKLLFEAETTIVTSYDLVNTFTQWEYENRARLTKWPGIYAGAQKMRADYPQWYQSANALRDAYASTRDVETGKKLATTLALLRAALNEAAGYMAQAAKG